MSVSRIIAADRSVNNLIQERLSLLDQLASKVSNAELLASIKEAFSVQDIHVPVLRGHYALHHQLIVLTDEMKETPELKILWDAFLKCLKGVTITYDADGTQLEFDVTEEINRLHGESLPYNIELLDPKNPDFEPLLDQFFLEEKECCGISRQYTRQELTENLSKPNFICYIARRKNSPDSVGQLLGHGYAIVEKTDNGEEHLHGYGFGRRAFAAKLGVGKRIFEGFANRELPRYRRIYLEVRESNLPAKTLYEKMGFVYEKTIPNCYPKPVENALVMILDPKRLAELLAQKNSYTLSS